MPKVARKKFLVRDELPRFVIISKFGRFKSHFATITTLS